MADLIIFRCPQTGMDVETLLHKQEHEEARPYYVAVTCPACTRLHLHEVQPRSVSRADPFSGRFRVDIARTRPPPNNRCREHMHSNGVVMSKKWILLTCVLSLGSVGTSQAHPLDPPDIVYIDGLPCNSACQSYMAWSRQTSSMSRQRAPSQLPQSSANAVVHRATGVGVRRLKPAAPARIAKQAVPIPREMPRAKIAALQPADNAAAKSDAPPDKASAAANSSTRTIQEQVAAATALAERVTAATMAPAPEQKSNNTDRSDRSETVARSDAENIASASPNNTNNLVALLMARREIKSVSDLANKDIAIEDKQSASSGSVRIAIAAAGAAEVQLSEGQTKAIDRLISGEVPAAVLTLVSPEAADWFPEIAGFKIFRVPLSPRQ